jgi:electron transfer flavoprotein alpha subunit
VSRHAHAGLHIAALIKQIPAFESMALGNDGRLLRAGVALEMNAYCRRAVAQGVILARESGGTCTVYTLGPPTAEDVLREAIACGADAGVLITDPALAGSDTLATARALAAALERDGPFDLILVGRNSVDADTGQVGPEIAELLDLPFVGGVRELAWAGRRLRARCEVDDGWARAEAALPLVMSVAERLCSPCKAPPEARAAVDAERIRVVPAKSLGPGPWGLAGSPTRVGATRALETSRARRILQGPLAEQVREAVGFLAARGALSAAPETEARAVPASRAERGAPPVAVLLEPEQPRLGRELCGAAAVLAHELGGHVVGLGPEPLDGTALGAWGMDAGVAFTGAESPEDVARAAGAWAEGAQPWALLAPSTDWGREVAARVAAYLGAGLTGDAVALELRGRRLVARKPAFGGQMVAEITCTSAVQMATVRPGVLPLLAPRTAAATVAQVRVEPRRRIHLTERIHEDRTEALATAACVIGVGTGVAPEEYDRIQGLARLLGAELAATRKVTDLGWLPRARQVGITGHSISPRLYIAIGMSGKLNHTIGVRSAGTVLAINRDPEAPVFAVADAGIVGEWREVLALLEAELARHAQVTA